MRFRTTVSRRRNLSAKEHHYSVLVQWTGNTGQGTSSYRAYRRDHQIRSGEKAAIEGSSDPAFRGDPSRWNPEELLVAALSACHKLSYLHLCAEAGVVVTAYEDHAEGFMVEDPETGGHFTRVVLRPVVTVAEASDPIAAKELHAEAHSRCFIANSVNFRVEHQPTIRVAAEKTAPAL
jgi:organic hydroperoxide reductase OsmC/OhrA